jgi:hypothetical protein
MSINSPFAINRTDNNPTHTVTQKDNSHNSQFKRLTIDIPSYLHRSIKSQCALRGTKIADELRELLAEKYEEKY